ncbi:MAG: hypothetical protein R3E11_05725 [Sphingobium sp.]|nr:hypothetical protein [Sphingobium sp.]MCP5398993.1 hypothetical protein [Sphingomonas sp.]
MIIKSHFSKILLAGCATAALSACGADDVASPGSGGSITINNPTPAPSPTPSPTPTPSTVTAAADCPTVEVALTNSGTITGPTGTYRVCTLPAKIDTDTTLPQIDGLLYELAGRVDVGDDLGATATAGEASVTLTIRPGAILYGKAVSWLAVNRGNKLMAVGEAAKPIIFTSQQNVTGSNDDESSAQWGGVVLLGRAPITNCIGGATPGTAACQRDTEGASTQALYGGATTDDNSGSMKYVQIRYSGFELATDKELQGLTPSGIGTGTELDFIQIHNSSDDGIEFFGGQPRMKHVVITGAEDDSLDIDVGAKALIQYVIAAQRTTKGDSMIEGDSDDGLEENTPRTNLRLANFTFLANASSGNGASIMMRGGMDAHLVNGVVVDPDQACLQLRNAITTRAADATKDDAGAPMFDSVLMECTGGSAFSEKSGDAVTAADTQTIFEAGSNNDAATYTSSLTAGFINGANETGATAFDPSTIDAFFDATTYVGAVQDASDTWYSGWTCNSTTASFGASSTDCTALPVS